MNRPKWLRKAAVLLLAVLCAAVLLLSRLNLCHMGTVGARESVLRQDLQSMRMAIDNCTLDKKQTPQSLQDLVNEHYLRVILGRCVFKSQYVSFFDWKNLAATFNHSLVCGERSRRESSAKTRWTTCINQATRWCDILQMTEGVLFHQFRSSWIAGYFFSVSFEGLCDKFLGAKTNC
jgi:hypothetical protein